MAENAGTAYRVPDGGSQGRLRLVDRELCTAIKHQKIKMKISGHDRNRGIIAYLLAAGKIVKVRLVESSPRRQTFSLPSPRRQRLQSVLQRCHFVAYAQRTPIDL